MSLQTDQAAAALAPDGIMPEAYTGYPRSVGESAPGVAVRRRGRSQLGRTLRDFMVAFYDLFLTRLPGVWKLRQYLSEMATPLVPADIYRSDKKLNLGSSNRLLPGYINVDIDPGHSPDVVCDVIKLGFAEDGGYDLVRASHILEHFPYERSLAILGEWKRVIRPGGYLVVCVPDYTRLSFRAIMCPEGFDALSPKYNPALHDGWTSGLFALDLPPEYRHKSVYTESSLRNLLEEAGFSVIGRQCHQVEHPCTLKIADDSCSVYSLNLVARAPGP